MRTTLVATMVVAGCLGRSVIHPEGDLHNSRAAALIAAGQLAQARAEVMLALDYNPDSPNALVNLGLIEYREGHLEEAKAAWIKAARYEQESAQAYNNLGVLALDQRDPKTAAARFARALEVDPAYLEARRNLADAQVRLERFDDAELTLRKMIALKPDLSEPYHDLGLLRLRRGDAKGAAGWLEQAVQLEIGYSDAWKALGQARELLGLAALAAEAWESCLETAPGDLECAAGLRRSRGH